jgi:hypothetical protein
VATIDEIKQQRDRVSGAIDAWGVAEQQASDDATAAASAGAVATTAQQAADDSAALADQKRAEAQAEAQALSDMFAQPPARKRGGK